MITPIDEREQFLLETAHFYGATVRLATLPGTVRGLYVHAQRLILIRAGMTAAQRVSTLAHEVVHARRGDHGPQSPTIEAHVDEEAAGLVITSLDYRDAARVHGDDPRALAAELDVTLGLIVAWQRRAVRESLVLAG